MISLRTILVFFFFLPVIVLSYPAKNATGLESQRFSSENSQIEVKVMTESDLMFLKEIGLDCSKLGRCICLADSSQLVSLARANYQFRPIKKSHPVKQTDIRQSRIFQVKLEIKNQAELNLIKSLGLDCAGIGECLTEVNIEQMSQLKQNSIVFTGVKEGIRVEGTSTAFKPAGSTYGRNDYAYPVPWVTWTYSPITINNAPYDATVKELEVSYLIYDFDGQINTIRVDLTNENLSKRHTLWNFEGYGYSISETEKDTIFFDEEPVNQTWKLYVWDSSDPGRSVIYPWSITLWFSGPPVYMVNRNDYPIPDWPDSVCSPITVNTAPPNARVTSIDLHYDVIHTYIGDLDIWLTDSDNSSKYWLWCCGWGGDDDDIHETITGITDFNGELINQTWKLWATDWFPIDSGYIDFWSITLWYQDLPDLVIKSITPSNNNPRQNDIISVDMLIKNQGSRECTPSYAGLYYNLQTPPNIYTSKDKWLPVNGLNPGDSQLITFTGISWPDSATWNMYGLADCYGSITESDENNNYIGPRRVKWSGPADFPDLVVEGSVSGYCPYLTDSVFVHVQIKNQGLYQAYNFGGFYTAIFYDRSSAPVAPADGDDWHFTWYTLYPGDTDTFSFALPSPSTGTTWDIWLLVDSDNDIEESNENNNVYGPIEIQWMESPVFRTPSTTRSQIINKGLEFTNIRWVCPVINGTPKQCTIEDDWTSDYIVGTEYKGEAYEWGGFDDTTQFRCNIDKGLRAGAQKEKDCIAGEYGDPWWAAGIDCSGLVTRAFGIPDKKSATMLIDYCDSLKGGYEYVLKGDILIKRGRHTYIFDSWAKADSMCVIEAGDFREIDYPDHSSEARKWNREKTFYETYYAFKSKDVPLTADNNRSGDANSSGKTDVADISYLVGYLFQQGARPHPLWRGNSNGDCRVDIADIVYLVNYLFKGGPAPYDCQQCAGWTCQTYP